MTGGKSPQGAPHPIRFPLDDERHGRTIKFKLLVPIEEGNPTKGVKAVEGYFIINTYDDGAPGEVFVYLGKEGHELHGWADAWATTISMLLQYGIDPRMIYEKFKYWAFEPSGFSNVKSVPMCKSIVDLIVKYMEKNFPPTKQEVEDAYEGILDAVIEEEKS